ncbi:hypothetical protein DXG01_015446, partial [Tephrocybe rancida]
MTLKDAVTHNNRHHNPTTNPTDAVTRTGGLTSGTGADPEQGTPTRCVNDAPLSPTDHPTHSTTTATITPDIPDGCRNENWRADEGDEGRPQAGDAHE